MVFFTCNHCGDSVKKPAVDKHYNTKCRGMVKNVTCMDCQKDFFNEEYVAHTKCITEAEKYSGKDYVPKEFKNNKKQESWMEIVRSILNNQDYKISAPARGVFEKLQSFDNVPRKKQKFQNFITKCVRVHQRQAVEVWNVLEKELEKMKASKAPETKVKTEEPNAATSPHNGVKREVANGNDLSEPPKKKSKKQEEDKPAAVAATDLNSQQNGNSKPKKKKNKKQKTEAEVEETTAGSIQNEVEQTQSNKKKSKKQKSENSIELTEPTSVIAEEAPSGIEASEEFRWQDVLSKIVNKQAEGILLEKLKKKILKKYMSKLEVTEMTEKGVQKFEKKFNKYLKRCEAINVDGDLVKSA